ncbi:MAG: HIT family protein [Patescibacteria group bacterium]
MNDCIFCKIASKEIPSEIIWEDGNFVAFLDINPVTSGMTLVVPKKHLSSYIFDNSDIDISETMKASKAVAKILEKAFKVDRVAVIFEGLEVNHLHVKIFPLRKGDTIRKILNLNYPKPTAEELHNTALEIIKRKE